MRFGLSRMALLSKSRTEQSPYRCNSRKRKVLNSVIIPHLACRVSLTQAATIETDIVKGGD
jgi:hypothetical protein